MPSLRVEVEATWLAMDNFCAKGCSTERNQRMGLSSLVSEKFGSPSPGYLSKLSSTTRHHEKLQPVLKKSHWK
jgi:hypothetical protein